VILNGVAGWPRTAADIEAVFRGVDILHIGIDRVERACQSLTAIYLELEAVGRSVRRWRAVVVALLVRCETFVNMGIAEEHE
jgi:hypothetical protein